MRTGGHESCEIWNQNIESSKMYFLKSPQGREEGGAPHLSKFQQRQCPKTCDCVIYIGRKAKVPHGMILTYRPAEMPSSLSEKHYHKRNAGPSALFLHKGTTMFYLSWVSVGVCGIEFDHRYLLSTPPLTLVKRAKGLRFLVLGVPGFFQVSPVMWLAQDVSQLVPIKCLSSFKS